MAKKKKITKSPKTAEIRGARLTDTIKSAIPGAGFVKSDESSDGRKAFFEWQRTDFCVSSRLNVTECGFGRKNADRSETPDTKKLTERLKAAVC